jgi:N-acetylglutamate synthase-like GNAT family acetyltransferase
MPKDPIQLSPSSESDIFVIEQLARSLDLDLEDISFHQFITAKRNGKIIGFGRMRTYPDCSEIATVGVIPEEQKSGVGSLIIKELIRTGPREIFVTCVIPDFFNKFGFQLVKQYPSVLQKKVDFCKSYDYSDEQVFVMKVLK